MSEFLIKVRKNIQNALKVQVATMHRSMQNPLIHSIHQSIGVVMDKFLELGGKQEKKTSSSHPLPTRNVYIGAFRIRK